MSLVGVSVCTSGAHAHKQSGYCFMASSKQSGYWFHVFLEKIKFLVPHFWGTLYLTLPYVPHVPHFEVHQEHFHVKMCRQHIFATWRCGSLVTQKVSHIWQNSKCGTRVTHFESHQRLEFLADTFLPRRTLLPNVCIFLAQSDHFKNFDDVITATPCPGIYMFSTSAGGTVNIYKILILTNQSIVSFH